MTVGSAPVGLRRVRSALPAFVLVPFAAGAGLLASLAFAPVSFAPAAFAAVFVLAALVSTSARLRTAVLAGTVYGLAFNVVTLAWQSMIGLESYLGLAVVETFFFALLGGLLFAVRSARWAPLWSAGCWTLVELLQSTLPFGGFGWTRLGYAMVDTPLAGFYPLAGAGFVSFVVALVAHAAWWAVAAPNRRRGVLAAGLAVAALVAGGLGTLVPGAPASAPTIDVGWVQGGAPGGGVYGIGEAGTMGRNHAAETKRLLGDIAAGKDPKPAFIVWPENGTDMDPFIDVATNALIANSVADAGVPIFVTVPVEGPGRDERQTAALWWTNAGVQARYDKRNLVPFGEWIPFRDVLLPLIPMLQYVGAQTIPGTTPGALHVTDGQGRPLTVGVGICYEVAFPATIFDAIDHGAEIMVIQSSNAMFQGSPQIDQQFAITRVRAAETRRQILVVTTSGVSGLIDDHGRVVSTAPNHVAASGVATLTRTTLRTPVVLGGWLVEYLIAAATAILLLVQGFRRATKPAAREWTSAAVRMKARHDG